MSTEAENEAKNRKKMIAGQRNENSRIVSRLLTEHTNIQMSKISYPFVIACNTQQLDMSKVEKALVKLKSKMVDQLQHSLSIREFHSRAEAMMKAFEPYWDDG